MTIKAGSGAFGVRTLDAFDSVRLLAAFQTLSLPSGCMGATHKQARGVVVALTGRAPKRTGFPPAGATLETYLDWHGTPAVSL